jgi:hypothetical protein
MAGLGAASADAQIVTGRVVDSLTGTPIQAVAITFFDSRDSTNRVAALTDSAGRYIIRLPRPSTYSVTARRIGYEPLEAPARQVASMVARTLNFYMTRITTQLEAVVTEAEGERKKGVLYSFTAGKTFFNRHLREGKGFFTSGMEILLTGLHACDYLANVPGLKVSHSPNVLQQLGPLCDDGRVVMTDHRPSCMRLYVDRTWRVTGIDSANFYVQPSLQASIASMQTDTDTLTRPVRPDVVNTYALPQVNPGSGSIDFRADTISKKIPLEAVMGIEVFRNRDERPNDFSIPAEGLSTVEDLPRLKGASAPKDYTADRPQRYTFEQTSFYCSTVLIWTIRAW